eukprot:9110030-Pyramimonas_sp.AAC.1
MSASAPSQSGFWGAMLRIRGRADTARAGRPRQNALRIRGVRGPGGRPARPRTRICCFVGATEM